jgi:hypothetical protein
VFGLTDVYKNAFISDRTLVSSFRCSDFSMCQYRKYIISHCMNRGSGMMSKVVDLNIILTFPLKRPSM